MSAEKFLGVGALKRRFTGHDLIDRDPEAVVVGGGSQDLSEDLLRRHISPGPLHEQLATIDQPAETANHLLC